MNFWIRALVLTAATTLCVVAPVSATDAAEPDSADMKAPVKLDSGVLAGKGLTDLPPVPVEYLLSGVSRPSQTVLFKSEDVVVAVYEEDPVKLPLEQGMPYDEFVHVLEGTLVLTDTGGKTYTFRKGDFAMIPKGFKGTWETRTRFRELIVVDRKAWDAAHEANP